MRRPDHELKIYCGNARIAQWKKPSASPQIPQSALIKIPNQFLLKNNYKLKL